MRYMLDTDICSYVIRQQEQGLLNTLQTQTRAGAVVCISAITYAELKFGAVRSRNSSKHSTAVQALCDRVTGVLAWGKPEADAFARVQAALYLAGTPIGDNDAMIAAHALSAGCTLVTNNQRHFSRVSGLDHENWLTSNKIR